MTLRAPRQPLELVERARPVPDELSILVRVEACGVCRTDLHLVDGELTEPTLPIIPGHQIAGIVEQVGAQVTRFSLGDRVGIPWLGRTCTRCKFCRSGRENLCDQAQFTGYQIDGGFAEYAAADSRYAFAIPDEYSSVQAAPLLCAGLIGYRALKMTGSAERIGLYGFGSAAHIVTQVAGYEGREIFAFTRPGDARGQSFARSLGVTWAGDSGEPPPEKLDAAIVFAPLGELVPIALAAVDKGGTVVCAGIHMSDLPSFPYSLLWGERTLRSVANLTRVDGEEFLNLTRRHPITTHTHEYSLADAGRALDDLRAGSFEGSAVIVPALTTREGPGHALLCGGSAGRGANRHECAASGHKLVGT